MAVKVVFEQPGKKRILIKTASGQKQHYTVKKENVSKYRERQSKTGESIFSRAASLRTVASAKKTTTAVIPGRRVIGRGDVEQDLLEDMGEFEKYRQPEAVQAPIKQAGRPPQKVRPMIPTVSEYQKYQKPQPAVRGSDDDLAKAADENAEMQAQQQAQQQGTRILGEVVVIDETGEGILDTTDEQGRPTTAKTQFITDPRQQGLYTPVIDQSTGQQRMDYTRGRDHPRPVVRRTKAVIEQETTPQGPSQGQPTRQWGYSPAGRPVQLVLTVDMADENGNRLSFQGFSKTIRTDPGGTFEDRVRQCKVSALKRINIDRGIDSRDNSLMSQIDEYVDQNPDSIKQRELIY
jgi:hypothetical protein